MGHDLVSDDPIGADGDGNRALGRAIRRRRQERGLSLRELAQIAGLSSTSLSLVEGGGSSLGLTALERIATGLDTSPDALLVSNGADECNEHGGAHVSRGGSFTSNVDSTAGRTYVLLSTRGPRHVLEPLLLVVQPSKTLDELSGRNGEEFLYVLAGELVYRVDGERHRLRPGDSIHLDARVPHAIANETGEEARALVVLTPRFY